MQPASRGRTAGRGGPRAPDAAPDKRTLMKVTQLMLGKGFGGAERYFLDLVRYLARAGHEVQAICHQHSVCGRAIEGESEVELCKVNLRGPWDVFGVRRIGRLTREFGPEVIHTHLSRGAWLGGNAIGDRGPPLVANLHNYIKLKRYRRVDLFVPTTRRQEAFLRQEGVAEKRIVFIPNFSSMTPVDAVRRPSRGPVRFLSYGRMVQKKGFPDLLRAFAKACRQGTNGRLVLGGDGPERRRIEALARQLGVADRVEFPGWIEEVSNFLSRADVFVLPSHLEPFGIVLLEAMSMGVPIVTTRTEGPMEVLGPDTAFFADIADSDSLATAMQSAAAQPERRTEKAHRALDRYRMTYHDSVVVPRIVNVYRHVASAAGPGA